MVQLLRCLADVATEYDALICDIWGVVHNGLTAWPEACAALTAYREQGGIVILLTNSPRPSEGVQKQLDEMSVPRSAYDDTVTSGDLTRNILVHALDKAIHHIGPPRDNGIYDGIDITLTDAERAEFVLVTGLWDEETESPDDYADLLQSYLARGLTVLCANPDLIVERGDKLIYCAGALGQRYEEMGGQVIWAGKPHPEAYDAATAAINTHAGRDVPVNRVLAIGDSLRTDLAGGVAYGCDTLFIAQGIHAAEFFQTDARGARTGLNLPGIAEATKEAGVTPRYVMPLLR